MPFLLLSLLLVCLAHADWDCFNDECPFLVSSMLQVEAMAKNDMAAKDKKLMEGEDAVVKDLTNAEDAAVKDLANAEDAIGKDEKVVDAEAAVVKDFADAKNTLAKDLTKTENAAVNDKGSMEANDAVVKDFVDVEDAVLNGLAKAEDAAVKEREIMEAKDALAKTDKGTMQPTALGKRDGAESAALQLEEEEEGRGEVEKGDVFIGALSKLRNSQSNVHASSLISSTDTDRWQLECFATFASIGGILAALVVTIATICSEHVGFTKGGSETIAGHMLAKTESLDDRDEAIAQYVFTTVTLCFLGWSILWIFDGIILGHLPGAFDGVYPVHVVGLLCALLVTRVALYVAELFLLHMPVYLCFGRFTWMDFRLIIGPRQLWTSGTVDYFINTYGEWRVKVCDASTRRSSHCLNNFLMQTVLIPNLCPTPGIKLVAQQLVAAVVATPMLLLLRTEGWAGSIFFVGSRIRDGRYGRLNKLNVKAISLITFPASTAILIALAQPADADLKFLMMLTAQPLVWGDAFAEIIGSFFGQHKFQVSGIGEVNQKTVEGCVACWLSCIVAGWAIMSLEGFPLDDMHAADTAGRALFLVVQATLTTVMETFTFRSYDNLTIVMTSALTVSLFYRL